MPDEPIIEEEVIEEPQGFIEYAVDDCTVLEPNEPDAWRVRLADGVVTGIPGDPTTELTSEVLAAWRANPPVAPVDQATIWAGVLAGVITDPVTSIPLKASIATRDTLSATLLMLREAEAAGLLTGATEQTIWDADNVARTMTVAEQRGLILRYGFAWQTLHATYAP